MWGGQSPLYIDTGADSSGGTGRMRVDPDKLMQLKRGVEDEAERIRAWLFAHRDQLTKIHSPGNDPCSIDTADVMSQVGQTAKDKAYAYVARLHVVADKLQESAIAYGMTEDDNAAAFQADTR